MSTQHKHDPEQPFREAARLTPEGKLLVRYGYEPYNTESIARRVAEKAAFEISELLAALTATAYELQRLRDVHLPKYEGAIGEPDPEVLTAARAAIARATGQAQ